jgi:hypothetical protein
LPGKSGQLEKTLLNASIREERKKGGNNFSTLEEKKGNLISDTKKGDLSKIVEE